VEALPLRRPQVGGLRLQRRDEVAARLTCEVFTSSPAMAMFMR